MKDLLLKAPDRHLGEDVRRLVKSWDDEPSSLQLLETLDSSVHTGGGPVCNKCTRVHAGSSTGKRKNHL